MTNTATDPRPSDTASAADAQIAMMRRLDTVTAAALTRDDDLAMEMAIWSLNRAINNA